MEEENKRSEVKASSLCASTPHCRRPLTVQAASLGSSAGRHVLFSPHRIFFSPASCDLRDQVRYLDIESLGSHSEASFSSLMYKHLQFLQTTQIGLGQHPKPPQSCGAPLQGLLAMPFRFNGMNSATLPSAEVGIAGVSCLPGCRWRRRNRLARRGGRMWPATPTGRRRRCWWG